MNKEKDIINNFLSQMPKSCQHINDFFESDAEIIDFGSKQMLFTTDEFSGEDMFRDDNPHVLGWNMAVCTISDILASGGTPKFYAHSVQVAIDKWNDEYIKLFSKGLADVLNLSGTAFIGGDLGMSKIWHYAGICLGEAGKSLTRKGAEPGDIIYITGNTGAGNLEAALMMYSDEKFISKIIEEHKTYFELRFNESMVLREYATSCIDTSDGVLNALNTISEINNIGYRVRNLPYLKEGVMACELLGKPKVLLFMGECGEYELLFTIKKDKEKEFLYQAKNKNTQFTRIGEITSDSNRILFEDKKEILFNDFNISARDFEDVRDYLNELIKYLSA